MTQRQTILVVFFLTVGIVGVALFAISRKQSAGIRNQDTKKTSTTSAGLVGARKSDDGAGNVTVAARWEIQDRVLRFTVEVNTHSVDLSSFDPMRQIVLEDAYGAATPPTTIIPEGAGHHRSYTVDFPRRDGQIRLVIRGLAGVARRELVWPE